MLRSVAFVAGYTVLFLLTAFPVPAAQFGNAEEAKAMLERAVAAVKEDKAKALDMSTRAKGAPMTVIFICSAPTLRTAL